MKKFLLALTILSTSVFTVACSGASDSSEESTSVKIGISGSDTHVWEFIADKAKDEGIDIEIVTFSDYVQPNLALAEGDLDANAFQTVAYFDAFIDEHDLDLVPIATTVLAPMGVYSDKYTSVDEIPDGSQIAIPNDVTNAGRALLLLQESGLLTLTDDFAVDGTTNDIVENPKNIEIVEMEAAQTPRALPDVAASVINNGVAVDAGFVPLDDSIFHESATATPYVNIIATRSEDKDNETLNKIAEIYQTDEVAEFIEEEYKGSTIPTYIPLSDIGW